MKIYRLREDLSENWIDLNLEIIEKRKLFFKKMLHKLKNKYHFESKTLLI